MQVKQLQNPDTVFEKIIGVIVRLAEHGLIHCDFNEFNIMVLFPSRSCGNLTCFTEFSLVLKITSGLLVHCRLTMMKQLL